jgi:hypothetical protein
VGAPNETPREPVARNRARKHRSARETQADKIPAVPPGLLHIMVSIEQQKVTLFANGAPVASSAISSGTPGHPTPLGVFSVIQKNRHHVSNLYGAQMPYMQRLTWSGTAMHQGPLPGYPASHGCIRLTKDFAQLLWKATKIGARVIVTKGEAAPVEIEHVRLFVPRPRPFEAARDRNAQAMRGLPVLVKTADATDVLPGAVVQDAARPIAPAPQANARSAEQASKLAGHPETRDPVAAVSGPAAKPAEGPRAWTAVEPGTPSVPRAIEGNRAWSVVEAAPVAAGKPVEPPAALAQPSVEPAKPKELLPAPNIMVEERDVPRAAPAKAEEQPAKSARPLPGAPAVRKNATVSVFVSRKEGKVYVRHGMEPLFDTPVAIEQPDRPLGTHVYTAMELKDGGALRWTVVSIPSGFRQANEPKKFEGGKKRRNDKSTKAAEVEAGPPSNAREALERIALPQETVDRIAELVAPGASLIISDNKLSGETGRATDFIVLTR